MKKKQWMRTSFMNGSNVPSACVATPLWPSHKAALYALDSKLDVLEGWLTVHFQNLSPPIPPGASTDGCFPVVRSGTVVPHPPGLNTSQ
ncbi:Hypothetical predicted protein, partial [Pelobates cultripes]